jgi:hypothetical protein
MPPRLRLALVAAVFLGLATVLFLRRPAPGPPAASSVPPPVPGASASATLGNPPPAADPRTAPAPAGSAIADALNAPAGTLRRDLEILDELFGAFHTNFPRLGNPVGENAEITAALTGENPAHFVFLSPRHRALNTRGELCDRWGTPFRFHQLSGTQMEIRSAGPDRKFATPDDAVFP